MMFNNFFVPIFPGLYKNFLIFVMWFENLGFGDGLMFFREPFSTKVEGTHFLFRHA